MPIKPLLSSLLAALVASAAVAEVPPPAAAAAAADEPLALYDGGTVTRGEYESWLLFIHRQDEPEKRAERIASIAFHEAQAARAEAAGLGGDAATRVALLDFESHLLHRELRRHLAASLELGEGELEAAVEARKDAFYSPRRVRLRNFLARYPEGSDEAEVAAVRRRVEAVRERLLAGADFEELARRESDSQTRFRGGLIGWVRPGDMVPEVEKVALALEPGELSPVLATEDGFTVLRCEEVEEERRPPLEEVRARIEKQLRQERMTELWREFEEGARAIPLDLAAARGAGSGDPKAGDRVVAELPGDRRLTAAEVAALLQVRGIRRAAGELREERLESIVRGLIEQILAADRARALGLDQTPETRALRHWSRVATLSTEWMKAELRERFVPLDDEEIRAYFEAHRKRFERPAQTRLGVILIPVAERAELPRLFRHAESVVAKIRDGALSFEEAARRYSQHPSAENGGDAGWLSRTQIAAMGPNVLTTVDGLEAGEMSGLVQQPEGVTGASNLWIVRRIESRPAALLDFEEAATAAENALGNERTRALQAQIQREVISRLNLRLAEGEGSADAEGSAG
jgi:parvulin-like peptidyl-prolyl isomerase